MPNKPGEMHPQDKRNLIIFLIACMGAYFAYDTFVHRPQMQALQAQQAAQQAAQKDAPVAAAPVAATKLTREDALKQGARITIENVDLSGSLNLTGGRIDDLSLRSYYETVAREKTVSLLAPARTEHPLYLDFGWIADASTSAKLPDAATVWTAKDGTAALTPEKPVTLTWTNGQGLTFERTYAVDAEYMFTITQSVTNKTGAPVKLHPYASISRQGLPADFENNAVMHQGPIGYIGDDLHEAAYEDLDEKPRLDFAADTGWAGFTDKYWFSGIIPAGEGAKTFRFVRAEAGDKPVYQIDSTNAPVTVEAGATASTLVRAYVGPKKLELLNRYRDELKIDRFDLVIDFGKFWFLTIPFFHILTWLGHSIGSFAIAILVFTVILRLAVFPLANKSYRSFARMRKIQPKMLEVREKYADDRARLQQAIFELYKKEDVNPMAGCLPLLIQIPIFFALYKVLYITIEMRHVPFWGWIADMSAPDPLSVFTGFGAIPWDAPAMLQIGAWPIIMGFTMHLQQRMNPPAQDATQAKIIAFMPVMITLLMAHMPAGLVIYWSWSNCLSIIQQYVLMRQEGVDVSFFHKSDDDKRMEDAVAHGPAVHPAAEEIAHDMEAIEGTVVEKTVTPPKPRKKR